MSRSSYIVPFAIAGVMYSLIVSVIVSSLQCYAEGQQLTWWLLCTLLVLSSMPATMFLWLGMCNYETYWADSTLDEAVVLEEIEL